MQYVKYNEICSQGTQTKLSTASKDDVLVSFTSTCSLLSSTFTQFLLEVSRMLQIPIDKQHPLISVEKLLSEFKERSLEINNIDRTELSFHSPLVPMSPESVSNKAPLAHSSSESVSGTPSPPTSPYNPTSTTPPTNLSTSTPPFSSATPAVSAHFATSAGTPVSVPFTTPLSAPRVPPLKLAVVPPLRLPLVPVPAKITKEQADSTNRITPPLPLNEIGMSARSAFCKPFPKAVSPHSSLAVSPHSSLAVSPHSSLTVSPHSSLADHTHSSLADHTQIKVEPSTPPANTQTETELLECLQKLQNCYEKYLTPPSLPFSLNNLLHDIKPRHLADLKPPNFDNFKPPNFDNFKPPNFDNFKPPTFDNFKPPTFGSLKLPLPSTFRFLERGGDPNSIIKAMQQNNPLLNNPLLNPTTIRPQHTDPSRQHPPLFSSPLSSPLISSSPMKCPYCNLTFHKKSHLSNHLVQLHSHSYHCCRQCKISFPDRQSLEHHQRSHPKQQFQCSGCNLSFKTGSELKRHVKTHTQERAFMCEICGSRFNLKHNLKAHMRQHTGERPFRCKICNRGFTRSNNLKRHLYAHCSADSTAPPRTMTTEQVLSMLPNMVMFDGSRLQSTPVGEVKVD